MPVGLGDDRRPRRGGRGTPGLERGPLNRVRVGRVCRIELDLGHARGEQLYALCDDAVHIHEFGDVVRSPGFDERLRGGGDELGDLDAGFEFTFDPITELINLQPRYKKGPG